jgi:hypothetical protein
MTAPLSRNAGDVAWGMHRLADAVTRLSSLPCGCVARIWPAGAPFLSSKTAGPGSCDAPGHGARD